MWSRYDVRWDFMTILCASLPGDSTLVKTWLDARAPTQRPPDAKGIDEIAAEVLAHLPDEPVPQRLVFARVNGGLAMGAHTIRAHLKDCARVLSSLYVGRIEREKSFAVKVANAIYWDPKDLWVPIVTPEGEPITEPTGVIERPGHPVGRDGPQSVIKVYEYITGASMRFGLLVLTQPGKEGRAARPIISQNDLETIMMYGGTHGYGGERSLTGGRYAFHVSRCEEE